MDYEVLGIKKSKTDSEREPSCRAFLLPFFWGALTRRWWCRSLLSFTFKSRFIQMKTLKSIQYFPPPPSHSFPPQILWDLRALWSTSKGMRPSLLGKDHTKIVAYLIQFFFILYKFWARLFFKKKKKRWRRGFSSQDERGGVGAHTLWSMVIYSFVRDRPRLPTTFLETSCWP